MDQDRPGTDYEAFYCSPHDERIRIFNDITPANRALLIKTHAGRWLAVNRARLQPEQTRAVEQFIETVSPEWYQILPEGEDVHPEAEALVKKIEAVLSRDDLAGLASPNAAYIPGPDGTAA